MRRSWLRSRLVGPIARISSSKLNRPALEIDGGSNSKTISIKCEKRRGRCHAYARVMPEPFRPPRGDDGGSAAIERRFCRIGSICHGAVHQPGRSDRCRSCRSKRDSRRLEHSAANGRIPVEPPGLDSTALESTTSNRRSRVRESSHSEPPSTLSARCFQLSDEQRHLVGLGNEW